MAIPTCIVSGTIKGPDNSALNNVTVRAYSLDPFFHTDGTLISDYQVSTTTDSSGAWSLTLIVTVTIPKSLTVAIDLPTGAVERERHEYTIVVPNTATANFSDLATGQ